LLDLFDSINLKSTNSQKAKGTFFILGWLADRLPHLVKEIQSRGHEVASHGYFHRLGNCQSPRDLKEDLIQSKNRLEDIIGQPVFGYRA
ncbi:polysaccharide deacetylase family protein, partial [Desulfobacteraceae bacterium SEEP-SAG9]